jgi:hypothetical protein
LTPSGGEPNTPPSDPPPSQIQTAPNLVSFDPKQTVPSQPIYLQRNDFIGFLFVTNQVAAVARIRYRWLTPQGEIKEGELDTPPFGGTVSVNVPLYEGWLLSFVASVTSGFAPGFFCFLQVALFRSAPTAPQAPASALIWQGYLGFNAGNGYPGTPSKEIIDGAGTIRSITGGTPAAGADISEVVPTLRRWTLLSFRAALTTSATVANRTPAIFTDDGVNILFAVHTNVAQVASTTNTYYAAPGNQFFNDGLSGFLLPFPTVTQLKSGFHIKTSTNGIQAGDQWTAPQYEILEWGLWDT